MPKTLFNENAELFQHCANPYDISYIANAEIDINVSIMGVRGLKTYASEGIH